MIALRGRVSPWKGAPAVKRVGPSGLDVPALPAALNYLATGDIVRVVPERGEVGVLYRRSSRHNTMLLTENCNSNCIMCSQPPKAADDSYLTDVWLEAIPLMDAATEELGITGGEPTLLGDRFVQILRSCREHLPSTAIHVLSNGRMFNYLSLAQQVGLVGIPNLMIGIPLYSDLAAKHDFIVQARGAFDQTVRGLYNLKRSGVAVEIRIVIHRESVDRLRELARFIARNLPFADHVAFMGLEPVGYAKANFGALWVDPADYGDALRDACEELVRAGVRTSIYNHQLCTLDVSLWPFARMSISDWKNEYVEDCGQCHARARCCGFFSSATASARSRLIRPVDV